MVDHVKGRNVVKLFSRQKEEGVEELCELAEEVPPGSVGHSVAFGRCGIPSRCVWSDGAANLRTKGSVWVWQLYNPLG